MRILFLYFSIFISSCLFARIFSSFPKTTEHYLVSTKPETRIKIAVIDTGIKLTKETKKYLCNGKHYDVTGKGIEDTNGHGTNIAGIISKQIDVKKFCIIVLRYFDEFNTQNVLHIKAFELALKEDVKYINFSSGGLGSNLSEKEAIQKILNNNIYFITASGNNNQELSTKSCNYFPACYNFKSQYFKVVGNGKSNEDRLGMTNFGEVVTDWRPGMNIEGFGITLSGSSQSTAVKTGELVSEQ